MDESQVNVVSARCDFGGRQVHRPLPLRVVVSGLWNSVDSAGTTGAVVTSEKSAPSTIHTTYYRFSQFFSLKNNNKGRPNREVPMRA